MQYFPVYTVTVAGLNDQLETIEAKLIEAAKFTSNHLRERGSESILLNIR